MRYMILIAVLIFFGFGVVHADGGHHHAIPTLKKGTTTVTYEQDKIVITFGPIDLPVGHSGDLAASMPKHFFRLPEDRYLTGFKSEVLTKDGTPLPQEYLHHILLVDMDQESISCPGEPLFFAGAGMELTEAQFPQGYGVKLDRTHKLMALVAFYHKAKPTKDALAKFTMYTAPVGSPIEPMQVYQVGVNVVCFSKFDDRPKDQTDEGIHINPGVQVMSAPLRFLTDGCVKYAYPHGHNGVLLIALEDQTRKRTLLRTVPSVSHDGTLLGFPVRQIFSNADGFSVNRQDTYEMVLVHHRPLQQTTESYGMGNYLLYMTPGPCSTATATGHQGSGAQTPG